MVFIKTMFFLRSFSNNEGQSFILLKSGENCVNLIMFRILNLKVIFNILSRNLLIITVALLFCVPVGILYKERIMPFIASSSVALLTGLVFLILSGKKDHEYKLGKKDAFFIVTVSWIIISLIGSLPYIFSGSIPLFINAFFESISGFTTTGSSILTDIEALPKSILFWRSFTHWIGGIGIIVFVIIIMPKLHIAGYHLFTLESSFQEKIAPKVRTIGKRLLIIYLVLTLSEIFLLLMGKMNLFESVCHAFGTVATGGFSPKNSSIASYSSYIQYIIMLFMVLGGTNFVIHYYFLKREFRKLKRNEEIRFYLFAIFAIGTLITCILILKMHKPVEEAIREGFFQVISILTCTGYTTADYLTWPVYAWMIIFLAMFIGGSTGSTAGGIKMARHLVLIKNIKVIFRRLLSPNAIIPVRLNNKTIDDKLNSQILSFISIYLVLFIAASLLLTAMGIDIKTAGGSVATCMAGIGPGIGSVGPAGNFAHLPAAAKIILSFMMLIGRLEIYPIIIILTRGFWRL